MSRSSSGREVLGIRIDAVVPVARRKRGVSRQRHLMSASVSQEPGAQNTQPSRANWQGETDVIDGEIAAGKQHPSRVGVLQEPDHGRANRRFEGGKCPPRREYGMAPRLLVKCGRQSEAQHERHRKVDGATKPSNNQAFAPGRCEGKDKLVVGTSREADDAGLAQGEDERTGKALGEGADSEDEHG